MIEKHVFGPIRVEATPDLLRADLEFYGIDHFRPSYVARIFLNDPEADIDAADESRPSYAGAFAIFGHQRCVGSEGHCEVHGQLRRFDDRPSHPLTRAFKRVTITSALRACLEGGGELTITVIVGCADSDDDPAPAGPLLSLQGFQLTTFV